jgi:hypothetical protein
MNLRRHLPFLLLLLPAPGVWPQTAVSAIAPAAPTASALPVPAADTLASIPAVDHYFALTRARFSGAAALNVVAFMDDYFRVPGNTGFNATIHRVEDILKSAGYVEEKAASPGARLTYRIEHRPLRGPTWEPVSASVRIAGDAKPLLEFTSNRNMLAINSASTAAGGVTAEVVDVGKATAAELDRQSL